MRKRSRILLLVLVVGLSAPVSAFFASSASAATNQFRGVNWADSRDNFQSGVLYISGLSSSDTYASALATGTSIMDQFISKLGANAVRMPINEATVSTFWSTYTGAIDAVLAKGKVVLCYWDSAKSNKPPDMNAFWSMWKTVVDKYGSNDNAYFEIFNEPNMYSQNDLVTLYTSWLTQFSTVPKSRVILDGTGNAQNVPDIGSVSSLDGCLLAVHDYSFFGSDTMTTESQWVSQFKGEVGSYSDRTVCTEWGGPMTPGSKNGVSYGALDYSQSPTNYFEAYLRAMSSQLRAWSMGSFYWPGLRDGDWYSMTTRSGTGANLVLTVPNQSGLAQLQNAWTGPAPTADAGAGGSGSGGRSGSDAGTGGATTGGAGGGVGTGGSTAGGRGGVTGTFTSSAGGSSGLGGTLPAGTGGAGGTSASSQSGGSGGRGGADAGNGGAAGSTAGGSGGAIGAGGATGTGGMIIGSGGTTAAAGGSGAGGSGSGGAGEGGHSTAGTSTAPARSGSGCSCEIGRASGTGLDRLGLLLGLLGLATFRRLRQRGCSTGVCPPMTKVALASSGFIPGLLLPGDASAKTFTDYFKPTPIVCPATTNTWGDKAVLPRDTCNGLEDATGTPTVKPTWMYWDGKLLRAGDGKYHMFADRWPHANGMGDWVNSDTVHAVSTALLGPYVDQGYAFDNGPDSKDPHKGHNVTASELPDGTYCLIVDEIVPFTIFTAGSLDGPWTNRGHAQIDTNGVPINIPQPGDQHLESNISFVVRPDGNYEIIQRHGIIAISTTGLLGPYKVQQPTTTYASGQTPPSNLATIYPNRPKHLSSLAPQAPESVYVYAEDPIIWYSGGQYHVIYDYPDDRVAYHLTSPDGIRGWTDQGLAFDPRDSQKIFTNSDGSIGHWYNVERPNVIMEDGHVAYFTFAVSDVFKMGISGNSNDDTKVVVVAFDGVTFDQETGIGGADGGAGGSGGAGGHGGADGSAGGSGGRDAPAAGSGGGSGGAGGGSGGATSSPPGTGGTVLAGGTSGSAATAGRSGSGGTGSTGGTTGSGGTLASTATGGRSGTGSAPSSGGSGGAQSYGGSSSGSHPGTGGSATTSGSSGGTAETGGAGGDGVGGGLGGMHGGAGGTASSRSGCACGLADRRRPGADGLLAAFCALALFRRRRRPRSVRKMSAAILA